VTASTQSPDGYTRGVRGSPKSEGSTGDAVVESLGDGVTVCQLRRARWTAARVAARSAAPTCGAADGASRIHFLAGGRSRVWDPRQRMGRKAQRAYTVYGLAAPLALNTLPYQNFPTWLSIVFSVNPLSSSGPLTCR
jgi:hypothetical protein